MITTGGSTVSTLRSSPWSIDQVLGIVAVLMVGAMFGFFYAWVCSTMWGLDAADPRVAIEAMQAMNGSVRNAVFFPAFFLTPLVLVGAGLACRLARRPEASRWFLGSAVLYLVGGLGLTMAINVPMNEALAEVVIPATQSEAARIWTSFSDPWQFWNGVRTIVSGVALCLACIGLTR